MKCVECMGEWLPPPETNVKVCPFCGNNFYENMFNKSPERVIRAIIDHFGKKILLDNPRLTELLTDCFDDANRFIKLVILAINDDVVKKLYTLKSLPEQKRKLMIKKICKQFAENNFLVAEAATQTINCFTYALGFCDVKII